MNAMLPVLSVLFAVFATAVPWGLPGNATFILPMIVLAMLYCWRALPGTLLPPYAAMLLGLLTDILSGGPLGFWALMALIAATAGGLVPWINDGQDRRRLWTVWCFVGAFIACLCWLLASLYFLRWIDWWPIAVGALASMVLFPIVLRGVLWIRGGRIKAGGDVIYRSWS